MLRLSQCKHQSFKIPNQHGFSYHSVPYTEVEVKQQKHKIWFFRRMASKSCDELDVVEEWMVL